MDHFGQKHCGKFKVEVPAPDCYDFKTSELMEHRMVDDENYVTKVSEHGSQVLTFPIRCAYGCCGRDK